MKILETERLTLHRMTNDDAPFMLELMNEPQFIRFVADRGLRTVEDAAGYLAERILPSYEQFGFGFYRVDLKESGIPIGICGFIKRETLEWADIGFALLQRFCGRGYAGEAARATMEYGRTVLKLPRIVAVTMPGNRNCIRLLENLGLQFEEKIVLPGYGPESLLFG
jgi:RimJ/RimL family protein N-acetyltransferase